MSQEPNPSTQSEPDANTNDTDANTNDTDANTNDTDANTGIADSDTAYSETPSSDADAASEAGATTSNSDAHTGHSAGDDARDTNTAEPIRSTDAESDIVVETQPTLKPTILSLATVLVVGIGIIAYLFADPTLLGTTERTEIAANLVVLLTVVGAGRFLLRLYVLTRTRYVVTPDAVRREYSLLYKTFSRELPLSKIRSHELRRSRIETVLGIGSVGFLTGSVSQSPTHLEFENVPHPDRVRRQVREQLPGKES